MLDNFVFDEAGTEVFVALYQVVSHTHTCLTVHFEGLALHVVQSINTTGSVTIVKSADRSTISADTSVTRVFVCPFRPVLVPFPLVRAVSGTRGGCRTHDLSGYTSTGVTPHNQSLAYIHFFSVVSTPFVLPVKREHIHQGEGS